MQTNKKDTARFLFSALLLQSVHEPVLSQPLYTLAFLICIISNTEVGQRKNKVTNKIRAILFVPAVEGQLFLQECLRSLRGFEARFISVIF